MLDYARNAHKRGIKVIIAGAGGAAHLPGMVAALTPLPTVGVPVTPVGAHLDGLDALLSIVQVWVCLAGINLHYCHYVYNGDNIQWLYMILLWPFEACGCCSSVQQLTFASLHK